MGYCAVIPTQISLQARGVDALWWVDLYVDPRFRGQGVERMFDESVRSMARVTLGVPNHAAVEIHRRHGWGVRHDYRIMVLPLAPEKMLHAHAASDRKTYALQCAAWLASSPAWLFRRWLGRYEPTSARALAGPDAEFLAGVFKKGGAEWVTTNRSADFIRWRYLDSPHRSQYRFYVAGGDENPSLVLISRTFLRNAVKMTRLLDIFGDMGSRRVIADGVRTVLRDAVGDGVAQVSAQATHPAIASVLRSAGFVLSVSNRFCWLSSDSELMHAIGEGPCHWVLADGDNDSVD